jgi:DNA-binding winged helix-turn-helix (wHTH) protein
MKSPIYEFGPFVLQPHARRLSRNGESVQLAAPEFELRHICTRCYSFAANQTFSLLSLLTAASFLLSGENNAC